MSRELFARIGNRRSIAVARIPTHDVEELAAALAHGLGEGWRIVTLFGTPEGSDRLRLIAIVADDSRAWLGVASAIVGQRYPAVSRVCRQAARFEREIAEQCGAAPEGHACPVALRRHAPDHVPAAWTPIAPEHAEDGVHVVRGDEVHEVAVGPVHAGIIEPGHFRLQMHGEDVLALDIILGWQHSGVEPLLETLPRGRAVYVAESIAGDSVIAHASAWCGAHEALARCHKSPRAQSIRGIVLELERLANHIGDLGAISGDVAYQPAASYFGRMRGDCLNLLMLISGNRLGRGLIRPGGVSFDITPDMATDAVARLEQLRREVRPVADLFFGASSVQSRLEGIGALSARQCLANGYVGPVARSCEVRRDVRHDHPYGVFRFAQIPVATAWAGDVYARALVRWVEVQRSLDFVIEQLRSLPRGELRADCAALVPGELVVALEEGWRGEVAHVLMTDDRGHVRRHKVTDPSFRNWPAVSEALPGNQISDFPLCNKSFNLSYSGHDL